MSKRNPDNCPICGRLMEIICSGHASIPFIDGRKYSEMCFICFSVPKIWEIIPSDNGSEDTWEGPFYDHKHLFTAEEMIEDGVAENIKMAKKSITSVKKRIAASKKCGRI